jgi:DHA2 family multidrug resistance protein-like MFS transporter
MKASVAPRAGRREWIGLAVIALPCMLYSMDLTVLHLAIPKLTADLHPTSAQMLWIIDIYGFLVAGSLLTMGTLEDRIGRRRLLLIGAGAFGVGSVLAAFSTSAEMLIVTRALLGVAGATLAPSTMSLIRNMFHDPRQFTTAIGVWISAYSAGAAIGPVVGGVVLEFFWWGAVFLIGVPVMALLLVLGPLLLPEYRDPAAGRPDVLSAVLSLAAVLAVIFGLKLIDPRLFRVPAFNASLALYGLGVFVMFGGFLFGPQYLQLVLGLSPLEAGLWSLPWAVAFILGSLLTPRLVGRSRPATLIAGGLVLAALGFAALTQLDARTGLALLVPATVAFSLGLAPLFTLTNDLIISSAPPERAGAASGVSETCAELGGALGIAIFGSIGIAVYRAAMPGAVPGVPLEALTIARDTLGGAIVVGGQLPDGVGAPLVDLARQAFTDGLQLTAAISAAGAVALAVFAATMLRRVRAGSEAA